MRLSAAALAFSTFLIGCDGGAGPTTEAGPPPGRDVGEDAGGPIPDAGLDAGLDAGVDGGVDGGRDAGLDAGVDAGLDAGHDAGASQDAGLSSAVLTFTAVDLDPDFYAEGVAAGDIDGDGAVDLVAGPFWYAGPTFATRYEIFAPVVFSVEGSSNVFHAWTLDVDDDGWLDVVTAGYPGAAATWFENPGAGWDVHWDSHVAHPNVDNEAPQLLDVTGDQAPELVFHTGGQLGWATPTAAGTWPFTAVTGNLGYGRFNHGLGRGDLDGDGDHDLLLFSGWWEQPDAADAGLSSWPRHDFSFGVGGAQMELFDVDGDGDEDVVTSLNAHRWGLAWFENTGSPDAFERHLLTDDTGATSEPYGVRFSQPHALAIADLDGDGVEDIVTGKRRYAHGPTGDPEPGAPAVLYAFLTRRGDAGVTFEPVLLDDETGVGNQVGVSDLDADGDVDVYVSNKLGTTVFLNDRL